MTKTIVLCLALVAIPIVAGVVTAIGAKTGRIEADLEVQRAKEKARVAFEATIADKYQKMVALHEGGDAQNALSLLKEFESFQRTDYRDVRGLRSRILTASALARLPRIPQDDHQTLSAVYAELNKLNPENLEYAEKAKKHAAALKRAEVEEVARRSEAIVKAQKEREEKIKEALSPLIARKDEVESIIWYRHKNSPASNASKGLWSYIGRKSDDFWLRMKITYTADDWLFIKQFTFNVDGVNYSLPVSFADRKKDHSGGEIWEWVDLPVDAAAYAVLQRVAGSKRTILRYEGQQYHFDRDISGSEKAAIKDVVAAFLAAGGLPPTK